MSEVALKEETRETEVDLGRRRVLWLTALGLIAAMGAVAEACRGVAPTPTVVPTLTPFPTPTLAPIPILTPTPVLTSTPTPQPMPTATPTPVPLTTERVRIAHLLRRAGFGASRQELNHFKEMGLAATIDYLLDYEKVNNSALETWLQSLNLDLTRLPGLQRWWLLRMVYTQRPLEEKMVLFWHGLLTSGYSRVGQADRMWKQNDLFRQQALGRYDVLLKAISRDPAMLVWLDSQSNRKVAPNENFARELMELFSMGVGNYTEQDVRESARAFTGYFLGKDGFTLNIAQHDSGTKLFLGVQGNLNGDDVIDIIMKQPATANFVCTKLFRFFAYESPEPEAVSKLAAAFVGSGYSIKAVMRELLSSEAFYSEKAYRSRPKSPVEMVAGTLRTLGLGSDASGLPALMSRMGQTLFNPPDVAGWPGGPVWFNSSTLLERANFANRIATDREAFRPLEWLGAGEVRTPKETADYLISLLLDGDMSLEERAVLYDYANSALRIADTDAGLRALVYLVLAAPDYQLA